MARYDLLIKGGTTVLPQVGPVGLDIGVRNGRIAALADEIAASDGAEVVDARGRHVFPGAVDSHFHVGIYRPHAEDALSESASAVSGGVTTLLSYFRTGHHYLNKSGPYREIFPEVLALSKGRFWCDYGYHIAPMTTAQLDEIPWLVSQGVTSFKYYMFYKALTLSADSTRGKDYTMADEYDLGHLYEIMVRVAEAARTSGTAHFALPPLREPGTDPRLHCADQSRGADGPARPTARDGLRSPSDFRFTKRRCSPTDTGCPVNLLHLSSASGDRCRHRGPAPSSRTRHPDRDDSAPPLSQLRHRGRTHRESEPADSHAVRSGGAVGAPS